MARVTASPLQAYFLGLVATALIQSSSAVQAFAVTLVDAGAISLKGSFPILLASAIEEVQASGSGRLDQRDPSRSMISTR